MAESEGTAGPPVKAERPCPKCGSDNVTVQTWESSCGGYEDEKFTCGACGHTWWVDGIDS